MSYMDMYNQGLGGNSFGNYGDDFERALNELAPGMQQFTHQVAAETAQYHAEQYAAAIERAAEMQMMLSEEQAEIEYLRALDRQQGTKVRSDAIANLLKTLQQAENQGVNEAIGGFSD